ncbi:MAG: NADH-quinone oxidoreductase subunit F, partial [Dehalococcoidia bacterium]
MTAYQVLRQRAEEAWRLWQAPSRPLIKVGIATCSRAKGADDVLAALRQEVAKRHLEADVVVTGCLGLCFAEPLVEVHKPNGSRTLYGEMTIDKAVQLVGAHGDAPLPPLAVADSPAAVGLPRLAEMPFFAVQERRLMANCGLIDPENIDHYIARGGYEGLAKALTMAPEEVIKEAIDSGLWGRGGAAFPTGRKWEFLRAARGEPKYLLCNADEGDPGSFVNRN